MKKIFVTGTIVAFFIIGSFIATAGRAYVPQHECYNLTEITGVLTYTTGIFYVDTVRLHLGPRWYMMNTQSPYDYDGDGTLETIFAEIQGLLGTTITVKGHLHADGSLSVFFINGLPYFW